MTASTTERRVPCICGWDHLDIEHWVEGIGWCQGHCPEHAEEADV